MSLISGSRPMLKPPAPYSAVRSSSLVYGSPAWDDTGRKHAVEGRPPIEAFFHELGELIHVGWGLVGIELDDNIPEFGFDHRLELAGVFGDRLDSP